MAKRIFLKDITADDCKAFRIEHPNLSRTEVKNRYNLMYRAMVGLRIINELYPASKPRSLSREDVIEEMQRHEYRKDFQKANSGMYNWVLRNEPSLLEMYKPKANLTRRGIYVYEFSDGCAYVGLTYNFDRRDKSHKTENDSQVFRHSAKIGETPTMKIIERDLTVEQAKQREAYWIETYRSNGWKMLNKEKAGGLGRCLEVKFSQQQVNEAVSQCQTLKEFKEKFPTMMNYAHRNHIKIPLTTPRPHITIEEAKAIASKYATSGELRKNEPSLYTLTTRYGWLKILYPETIQERWNEDKIIEVAKNCPDYKDFHINHPKAYDAARRKQGLLQKIKSMFNNKKIKL